MHGDKRLESNDVALIDSKEPPTPELAQRNLNIRMTEESWQRFHTARKRLGKTKTNEEALLELLNTQERALAARERIIQTVMVTIPHPVLCCMRKLQSRLRKGGYRDDLSTAISYGLLYYVSDSAHFDIHPDISPMLQKFLDKGPAGLSHEDVTKPYAEEVEVPAR